MKTSRIYFAAMMFAVSTALPQNGPATGAEAYVDTSGILRWKSTGKEVSLFGVNYTTPFAYAYRAHKRLGLSLKKAIDLDVAQMARLGLDAFRVHVWDREISDKSGGIVQNEHLELFDYLLAKLADRGVKIILTPIAWWGNGWPEPDEKTDGFSQNYTKPELITNQKAREAQRKYLRQFIEHTNPYRKFSYKNDPSIIAIEIINEPHHPEDTEAVTAYINEMAGVLRDAGLTKPIFYNISENWSNEQANAVTRSNIQGISFQWYPTSLGHNKALGGNYLINVNKYAIPSDSVAGFGTKARMVYEFETADVGGSYMYPAIARSFREAGMQFATMFAYDPVQLAWSNTEYPTHFLNLLYGPSKALSLMIAAKAFHQLPRMMSYGNYPDNDQFGDFRVSYEENLSELNNDSEFVYSNNTRSVPKNAHTLKHAAGCGNSPIVQYDGTGAYFLDKLEDGIWRLEVYPDVIGIRDPFETASMSRQVARLFWSKRRIDLAIPDLGEEYTLHSLSETNKNTRGSIHSSHFVEPGIYLVVARTVNTSRMGKYLSKREKFLNGLYIPPAASPDIYVVNKTSKYAVESTQVNFRFRIAGGQKISNANLYIRRLGWRGFSKFPLKNVGRFEYAVVDTPKMIQSGKLEYIVAADAGDQTVTFPEGAQGAPGTWDFSTNYFWNLTVIGKEEPITLLDVSRDRKDFVFPHFNRSRRYVVDYRNGSTSENVSLSTKVSFSGESEIPFGVQLSVSDIIRPLSVSLNDYAHVVVSARSFQDSTSTIGVNFLMLDGINYGVSLDIKNIWQDTVIPLSTFQSKDVLILPDSYPQFLPKVWTAKHATTGMKLDLRKLQSIQIVLNPPSAHALHDKREAGFELISVRLVK